MTNVTNELLNVRINSIRYEAQDINSFELIDPTGRPLPPFTAGAHIDVHIDSDTIRQYSLCNDPAETERYVIAVLRDPKGRGGSVALHEHLRTGDLITISRPRNLFALAMEASHHLLLAGGIGVTPMMAMIETLSRSTASFEMHYCTRSFERTAFRERLRPYVDQGLVHLHHDQGIADNGLDISSLLASQPEGAHLYYCGPDGFMNAVQQAAAHWPAEALHREFFGTPSTLPLHRENERSFQIRLAMSDEVLTVPPDRTIVEVLREHGIAVDTSCKEGYCGTCMTRYLEGRPDHRDVVLDPQDRERYVLICCARSYSDELVLDL